MGFVPGLPSAEPLLANLGSHDRNVIAPVEDFVPKLAIPDLKSKKKSRREGHFSLISQLDRRILLKGLSRRVSLREVKKEARLNAHARFIKKSSRSNRSRGSRSGVRNDRECCARKDELAKLVANSGSQSLSGTPGSDVHRQIAAAVGFIYKTDATVSSLGLSTSDQ